MLNKRFVETNRGRNPASPQPSIFYMDKGVIESCKGTGCGFKCCSFASGGHIVVLPHEFDGHEHDISHLRIIDDDYFGGKKVKCVANDCKSCDGGYKPIMCRSFPLWVKSLKKRIIFRSGKCPLRDVQLSRHKSYVLSLFDNYLESLPVDVDIDSFLSKSWIDNYHPFPSYSNAAGCMEVKPLSMSDMSLVEDLEFMFLSDPDLCLVSDKGDIERCLGSGCSYGLWLGGDLVAYSLAFFTEYGSAYVEKCFVRQDYRGNGFQKLLLGLNLDALLANGAIVVFSMTSPDNLPSLRNFAKAGFVVSHETKYKGKCRIILKREL